jgi:hypothetical protein
MKRAKEYEVSFESLENNRLSVIAAPITISVRNKYIDLSL